jgi:nucleolar pre-ribosomal-associated protein 2
MTGQVDELNTSSILNVVQKATESKAAPKPAHVNQASGLLEDRFRLAQAFVIQCLEYGHARHLHLHCRNADNGLHRSTTWRPSIAELRQEKSALPSRYLVSLSVLQGIVRSKSKKLPDREKHQGYLIDEIRLAIADMLARCEAWDEPVAAAFVLTVALQAMTVVGPNAANALSIKSAGPVMETADMLCQHGLSTGWRIKALLVARFPDLGSIKSGITVWSSSLPTSSDQGGNLTSRSFGTYCDFVSYIDAVIGHLRAEEALRNIQALLKQTDGVDDNLDVRMTAVHRLIETLPATKELRNNDFGLATAHALLCRELRPRSTIQFISVAQCLQLLLELHPNSMNQSAIEMTLMAVSRTASGRTAESSILFESSAKVYTGLCRLTEILLRRHRMRLNGHFHLLVHALQALLQRLLKGPEKGALPRQEKHAEQFARLVTLVCEPMAGTLARSGTRVLDSVTDKAKRAAGQYMYLVLLLYVKLLLERTVPRSVTQALQPGVYAILDITPPEVRKIASEALDTNGRVIFKELYKDYQKFGRWGGV